jgi:hypothetical protein
MNHIIETWMLTGLLLEIGCLVYAAIIIKEKMIARDVFELTILSLSAGPLVVIALAIYIDEIKNLRR